MQYGLQPQDLDAIIRIVHEFSVIEEAILFGSRAKGNFKKGSDVDIAIKGAGVDYDVVASLSFLLNEESATPYFFDIVHYESIANRELLAHIDRVGKSIYTRAKVEGDAR